MIKRPFFIFFFFFSSHGEEAGLIVVQFCEGYQEAARRSSTRRPLGGR